MSIKTPKKVDTPSTAFTAGKFLTFRLSEESYGIEVVTIREIIRMQKITPVPQMPSHVRGVINLRGKVVPILDLRVKFDLPADDSNDRACMIVVDLPSKEGASSILGLVVDAVEEVISISESEAEPSPDFGASLTNESCLGIAKLKSGVTTLLDIEKVVNRELTGDLAGI